MYILRNHKGTEKVYTIDGKHISSKNIIDQIKKIYVPPAYKQVVYYLKKDLLAIGVDKKGRKQYIYSQDHKNSRHSKRSRIVSKVNKNIQKILSTITRDLSSNNDDNIRQCAAIIHMILLCNFRIGTESYAKEYKHYGITTLQPNHLKFTPTKLHINFVGKKGIQNCSSIENRKLMKIIKNLCHKNKRDNRVFTVTSSMVNDYLSQFGCTCKELRTWNANNIYVDLFLKHGKHYKPKEILKVVAQQLHNTPTVCKNSYLLKGILDEPSTRKILQNKSKSIHQIIETLV